MILERNQVINDLECPQERSTGGSQKVEFHLSFQFSHPSFQAFQEFGLSLTSCSGESMFLQ